MQRKTESNIVGIQKEKSKKEENSELSSGSLYQTLLHCLRFTIIGYKSCVLSFNFLYFFFILQSYLVNIFALASDVDENVVFTYVCMFSDTLDFASCLHLVYILIGKCDKNDDVDSLIISITANIILFINNILKLSAVIVMVFFIHSIPLHHVPVHIEIYKVLENFSVFMMVMRVFLQLMLLVNLMKFKTNVEKKQECLMRVKSHTKKKVLHW